MNMNSSLILAAVMPVKVVDAITVKSQPDADAHAVATYTLILAVVGILSFFGTIVFAWLTYQQGTKAERLRFTDKQILDMVTPEMREAHNIIFPSRKHSEIQELANKMFSDDLSSPVNARREPLKSYIESVGLYDNLFDRIATYADEKVIDENLYFSQYNYTVLSIYFLLKDHVWETQQIAQNPRITALATRAFLHFITHENAWLGDDELAFFSEKARAIYPGRKTEQLLKLARAMRNKTFLMVS